MHAISLGNDTSDFADDVKQVAQELGWIDPVTHQVTELGGCAADSCREYIFWLERDRALPFEGAAPHLSKDHFANKSVIEVGCGVGANLMSLADVVDIVVGVEPVESYIQFGSILRKREKMPAIDIHRGSTEEISFEDRQFDIVLCVSAHQYFDICPAFKELARLVKPGGQLMIIGGTLDTYLGLSVGEVLRRPAALKPIVITTLNTLSYMATRRRVFPARGNAKTSRPIYPMRGRMNRWLREAGLTPDPSLVRIGPETCFMARKDG
jgi:SAM-dependent methyltransferase